MSIVKNSHTSADCERFFSHTINSSSWMSQNFNVEATMLNEASAEINQLPTKKLNLGRIISIEILIDLILIGLALGIQLTNHSNAVESTINLDRLSQTSSK